MFILGDIFVKVEFLFKC